MAFLYLRRILMDVLPSCAMVEQGQILRIQPHLEKIHDHLWALNAVIFDAEARAVKEEGACLDWAVDVGATMVDLEDLLDNIIEQQEKAVVTTTTDRLSSVFLNGTREAFRIRVVCELKKFRRRLMKLVCRGFAIHLCEDMLHSIDPCRDEYSAILKDEVVGRDEDVENIIEILQQQRVEEISTQETAEEAMDETQNDGPPFVIAICDYQPHQPKYIDELYGGMGKTTLARMIYHHPWVKQHFQHRIWVDMSKLISFDVIGIAREFARAISNEEACSHLQSLTSLQEFWVFLHQQLSGSNSSYLLILDQLSHFSWDDIDKWDQLQHTLSCIGGPESILIVTTQEIGARRFLRASSSSRLYYLNGLPYDTLMELFMKHALMSRHVVDQDQLEKHSSMNAEMVFSLSQEFVNRKSNYPFLAMIYGSLSRYIGFNQCQEILRHLSTKAYFFREHYDEKKSLLGLLIFNHLPAKIGQLNIFYSKLNKLSLHDEDFMHMMFAESLTPNFRDKEERQDYLTRKQQNMPGQINIQYCSIMSIGQNSIRVPKQCFHLCLSFNSNAPPFPKALFEENNKLRTLIFFHEKKEDTNLKISLRDMFAKLVHLRILHLRDTLIQHLPRTIGKLVHLRYLNVSQTEIEKLPRFVCNLWNLQVLKLAHCERLEKLPTMISRLWKLKVLDLSYCTKLQMLPTAITSLGNLQELYLQGCMWLVQLPEGFSNLHELAELNLRKCVSLNQMPRGVGQMTNLIRLSGYTVYDDNVGISALAELKTLLHLKALCLQGLEKISNSDLTVVEGIKLHEKSMLESLSLTWQWDDYYMEEEDITSDQMLLQLRLIEGLQPNPESLKMLEIVSYMGSEIPSWMKERTEPLINLREIRLINLKKCKELPPLVHLRSLENIEISGMEFISSMDDAFATPRLYQPPPHPPFMVPMAPWGLAFLFRSLTHLTFSHMPQLEKWTRLDKKFPHSRSLAHVTLIHCPKFKFWKILRYSNFKRVTLEIWLNSERMLLASPKNVDRKHCYIHELKIVGCQELRFLPEHMPHLFPTLKELSIIWCHELISLPDWLKEIKSLKKMTVCGCTKLSSIPRGLRRSVTVTIENCPKLRLN